MSESGRFEIERHPHATKLFVPIKAQLKRLSLPTVISPIPAVRGRAVGGCGGRASEGAGAGLGGLRGRASGAGCASAPAIRHHSPGNIRDQNDGSGEGGIKGRPKPKARGQPLRRLW